MLYGMAAEDAPCLWLYHDTLQTVGSLLKVMISGVTPRYCSTAQLNLMQGIQFFPSFSQRNKEYGVFFPRQELPNYWLRLRTLTFSAETVFCSSKKARSRQRKRAIGEKT